MRRLKMKIVLFVSVVLIGLLINPNFFLIKANKDDNANEDVKAKKDDNQEEIIILDNSKINVDDSQLFTIGDIDGDGISEVITFKSDNKDSGMQWIINTYHKDNDIWFPVMSKIYSEDISGFIHKVDIGNFDNDVTQEIIIASWKGNSSKIYLFDFNSKQNEFDIEIIYELNIYISDLEVHFNEGKSSDSVYLLFCDNVDSTEQFETNVMSITRGNGGRYVSKIIYSEPKIYWNLFTIGQFIEQESDKNQILLYRYEVIGSVIRQAFIRIINSDNELLMEDTNIGNYSKIRDIIAWDRKIGDVDELVILETNNLGDDFGFENKLFYFKFNQEGLFEKKEQLLETNKILNQLDYGKLDRQGDRLFILDPYLGTLTYLRAFDHWASAWYILSGYWPINWNFDLFEAVYEAQLNILVSSKGDYNYGSQGSSPSALLADLYTKTWQERDRVGARIVIGISFAPHWPPWIGLAPGGFARHVIIFPTQGFLDYILIAHETAHLYNIVVPGGHCAVSNCYMNSVVTIFMTGFSTHCRNLIDRDYHGAPPPPPPPPGGGGCPFLSVFDGIEYIGEGLLDIHDATGVDKVIIHTLQTTPSQINNKIHIRLTEHPKTISHIDNVRLYGRLENGQWVSLHLKSAIHSATGEVRKLLWFSDDLKIKELGADHNNGVSETIDLEFVTDGEITFLEFRLIIEGNNLIIK
ncbi:hypothetical protein LCGC14_0606660 [marine sediment metagenome]|uniref:Uncharacterized protein n=1 Tax=marine sediment metagenome TaxID=412755 RepID=A0A0F9TV78_9ZZZZ